MYGLLYRGKKLQKPAFRQKPFPHTFLINPKDTQLQQYTRRVRQSSLQGITEFEEIIQNRLDRKQKNRKKSPKNEHPV